MWIRTAKGELYNTDMIVQIEARRTTMHRDNLFLGFQIGGDTVDIDSGLPDKMTAILDRIARALAAGLPFLDLGEPDPVPAILGSPTIEAIMQDAKANTLRIDRYRDAWCAELYVSGGDCVQEATGPTPDAAIANLKPTGTT